MSTVASSEPSWQHGNPSGDDWRVICSCQLHRLPLTQRVRRRAGTTRRWLRHRSLPLLLGAAVAVGAVSLPLDADIPVVRRAWNSIESFRLGSEPTRATAADAAATAIKDATSDPPLHLISPREQERFLNPPSEEQRLRMELVKEAFFKSRVPYGSIIYREAKRNGLDPEFVAAVVKTESDFRPRLISNKNAHGLMQIIPSTGELMGAGDLMDPGDNIRAGTRYLKYLTARFGGDRTKILAAYNAGEGTIARYGGVPPYRETRNYLLRVAHSRAEYSRKINASLRRWNRLTAPR